MKLATADIMRGLDASATYEYGIPGVVLMENAGQATVRAINGRYGDLSGKVVSIFVGPGNNGGDGLVIARGLLQLGVVVHVFLLVDQQKIKGDAAINWHIVQQLPLHIHHIAQKKQLAECLSILAHSAVIVDAIFGTGLKRQLSGFFAEIVNNINSLNKPVTAVDIASGLHSDNGQVLGAAVRADMTVTYGLAKPGHYCWPGFGLSGTLQIVDIGIPHEVVVKAAIDTEVLSTEMVAAMLPQRQADSHKGSYGHLLIIAGSEGKTGAAILAARGALRSGVGLLTCGVPRLLNPVFETALLEAMTLPLVSGNHFTGEDFSSICTALQDRNVMLLGPGIGTKTETAQLVKKLYAEVRQSMVVDADALNILAAAGLLSKHNGNIRILTPHPGEMARLTGKSVKEVQADRIDISRAFAKKHNVILVLKGVSTIIAAPDGRVALNPTGNSGMAAGGMGDVLSGVIGSLLAQGAAPWQAACAGVYVHGLAADRIACNHKIAAGFLASEVADELPLAVSETNT